VKVIAKSKPCAAPNQFLHNLARRRLTPAALGQVTPWQALRFHARTLGHMQGPTPPHTRQFSRQLRRNVSAESRGNSGIEEIAIRIASHN
jgi:hypothetical protein